MSKKDLADRMRERADQDQLPADHLLRVRARELDEVAFPFWEGKRSERDMLRAWARARRAWSEHTGEPLL